jgi:transcriptional regulator with PAS, ATPase and Fis domain
MQSILKEIQDTVIKYAEIIAKVTKVDVEIVDADLMRIAGTGVYRETINQSMAGEGFVYKTAISTGKAQVIQQPGQDRLCVRCPRQLICVEKFEMCTPIRLGQDTIGVIGLICFTDLQKEHLMADFDVFFAFLDQMSDFISAKAGEVIEKRRILQMTGLLRQALENMDKGVLIIDGDNRIIQANSSAVKQLALSEQDLPQIEIKATGDTLIGLDEFRVEVAGRSYYLMGNLVPVKKESLDCGNILMFDERRKVKSGIYKLTEGTQRTTADDILGRSAAICELKSKITKIAKSSSSVLITGESGTGKELFARAIHGESDRWEKPFVAINCGAIPDMLLESELFGYVKGAFTGADPRGKIGKFELANKGVLFLDEIGDMPLYLQVKLLRVLQDRKITRIGSNQEIQLDIRVIAATNKDLPAMISENKFREDLYYRLNVIPFGIPPLRSRPEDIPQLFDVLVNKYCHLFQKELKAVAPDIMRLLLEYSWPGNVRELENTVEFMINMMEGSGMLTRETLPQRILAKQVNGNAYDEDSVAGSVHRLVDVERREIAQALSLYGSTTEGKKVAAKKLGIGIATLYRKIYQYGLSK